jgi:hypothetical protein
MEIGVSKKWTTHFNCFKKHLNRARVLANSQLLLEIKLCH